MQELKLHVALSRNHKRLSPQFEGKKRIHRKNTERNSHLEKKKVRLHKNKVSASQKLYFKKKRIEKPQSRSHYL